LTAICTIEDTSKLKAGETILIQGGAGGVATVSAVTATGFNATANAFQNGGTGGYGLSNATGGAGGCG